MNVIVEEFSGTTGSLPRSPVATRKQRSEKNM